VTALEGSRDQPRRLAVLIAASGIDMIGFAMVFPLLPLYARDLNATPEEIGVLLAAYSVAQLLMAPIWGRVSDRYGRRPALLIGLSAAAAAYVVFAFADSFWLLLLSRLVQEGRGGTTAVAQAYVADTIQPSDPGPRPQVALRGQLLGVAIGPVFGSTAAHWGQAGPGLIAPGSASSTWPLPGGCCRSPARPRARSPGPVRRRCGTPPGLSSSIPIARSRALCSSTSRYARFHGHDRGAVVALPRRCLR
jgi:MFS family permease